MPQSHSTPHKGGRPRSAATSTPKLTGVALYPDERELVERIADAEQIPLSEVLRRGLRLYADSVYGEEVQAAA